MSSHEYLKLLEAESIFILREVVAQFERPVMLYSVGKDSSVLLRLAEKAFYPTAIPFPLLHIDTGYKFPEMYQHRDRTAQALGVRLIVHKNTSPAAKEAHPDAIGRERCCGYLKTQALLDALKEGEFDAAIGGARRDEERSRAKERIFSFRDKFGQWNPRRQKPELWNLYNGRILNGESIRVFPLSNWSELDVWEYIKRERLALVSLYFAAKREVVVRHGQLIPVASATRIKTEEEIVEKECRFRSLGCMPCSGAILSSAKNIDEIIDEIRGIRNSERSQRLIDYDGEGSMEKKKREGYF